LARHLLAEMADFLRTGNYPPEAEAHLAALTTLIRGRDFGSGGVVGSGEIEVPLEMIFQLNTVPGGVEILPAGAPASAGD
jgi:hypothetical protein